MTVRPVAQRRVTPAGVMVMTAREMAEDRDRWLELRRFRSGIGYMIGASEVASILGTPGCGTPVQVWHEKVNRIVQPDNPNMGWGRRQEPVIADYWRDLNRSGELHRIGLVASVETPWAQASLDRRVPVCPLNRRPGICALEIKTRGAFGSRRFHKDLPDDILAQVCWQLLVSGYEHIHYAILVGGNDYRQGVIRAEEDAAVIAMVLRRVTAFREAHLAGDFVPEMGLDERTGEPFATGRQVWAGREVEPVWPIEDRAESLIELAGLLHPERDGVAEIEEMGPVYELAAARAQAAAARKAEAIAKAKVLQQAQGARWVITPTDNGPEPVYEFAPSDRTGVDLDILREKYPDVYADPEVVTHTTSWKINIARPYKVTKTPPPEEN